MSQEGIVTVFSYISQWKPESAFTRDNDIQQKLWMQVGSTKWKQKQNKTLAIILSDNLGLGWSHQNERIMHFHSREFQQRGLMKVTI